MKKALALVAMATLVGAANAIIVPPGSSPGTAATIVRGPSIWADAGVMGMAAGDTHWWKVSMLAGEVLSAMTTPLATMFVEPDTVMSIWDSSGVLLARNDDSPANGLGSSVRAFATMDEDFYIAVVGFHSGDQSLLGYYTSSDSTEAGPYVLTASIVPEPATYAVFGIGALALLRRRKK